MATLAGAHGKSVNDAEDGERTPLVDAEAQQQHGSAAHAHKKAPADPARAALIHFARALLAEFLGTFALVAVACGSITSEARNEGGIQVCFAVASVLFLLVCMFDTISGAHFNPVVTLAMALLRRVAPARALLYVAAQLLGAVAGSAVVLVVAPGAKDQQLGATILHATLAQGVFTEAIATAVLVCVVLIVGSHRSKDPAAARLLLPAAVWSTLVAGIFFAGPITGASLNPARSFGPALVGWYWDDHWVYWVGPFLGSLAGVVIYLIFDYDF